MNMWMALYAVRNPRYVFLKRKKSWINYQSLSGFITFLQDLFEDPSKSICYSGMVELKARRRGEGIEILKWHTKILYCRGKGKIRGLLKNVMITTCRPKLEERRWHSKQQARWYPHVLTHARVLALGCASKRHSAHAPGFLRRRRAEIHIYIGYPVIRRLGRLTSNLPWTIHLLGFTAERHIQTERTLHVKSPRRTSPWRSRASRHRPGGHIATSAHRSKARQWHPRIHERQTAPSRERTAESHTLHRLGRMHHRGRHYELS